MTPLLLDINAPEFLLLIVLAVILFGPEKLPDLARKAARVIRYVRTMASSAQEQLSKELGPEFEDMDLRDLNPRTFVQKHLLDDVEPIIADVKSEITDVRRTVTASTKDVTSLDQRREGRQPRRSDRRDGGRQRSPPHPHPVRRRGHLPPVKRPRLQLQSRILHSVAVRRRRRRQRPVGVRPSWRPSRLRPRRARVAARSVSARAAGCSGSASTRGVPASPEARSRASSGIWASSGPGSRAGR